MLTYHAWLNAVASVLAGHGFLKPYDHLDTVSDYTQAAYDYGMTYVRCANNVAKAHEQGRKLGGAR